MNLQGRDLTSPMQGDDVALLHRELQLLGYVIRAAEIEQRIFRDSTRDAVLNFQRTRGLAITGVVEDQTARLINGAVDAVQERGLTVSGRVRHQDGSVLKGLRVRAVDRDLRREEQLGEEAVTDDDGRYQVLYTRAQFRRAEKGAADLIVRVFSPEGTQLAESGIHFNAPPQATIDVIVTPRPPSMLSEYERYLAELAPILDGESLAALTRTDLSFVVGETGIDPEHIELLAQAAKDSELTRVSAEAFYGWFRQNLPRELDQLLGVDAAVLGQALESAIAAKIVPARLSESLAAIVSEMAELNSARIAREEAAFTSHQVVGRLLDEATDTPLVRFSVRGFDLAAGSRPKDLGEDITNASGLFGLIYATPPDVPPAKSTRRLRLQILDPTGEEIHQTEITVATEPEQVLDIRMPVPATPQAQSPTLAELSNAVQLPISPQLVAALAERGIHTLADVHKTGGLSQIGGLPVAPDDPAIPALEAHASLSTLSSDLQFNDALIKRGFASPSAIARSTRSAFARAIPELGDFKTVEMYARAGAQQKVLTNATIQILASKANGFSGPDFGIFETLPQKCGCDDCEAAVSPLAYLADLLDYAVEHLENDGDPITLSFLKSTFHQRFGDLPASCEEVDRQVRQVRICIEVLRSYLKAKNLPSGTADKKTLADREKSYLLEAYTTLLSKIGSSYEEIRLARTAEPLMRKALAERLGIELGQTRPDHLDALFVEATALGEAGLETLFGLVDTTRDVLSEGAKLGDSSTQVKAWNLNGVEWGRNVDADGSVHVRLTRPSAAVFRVELFRDAARTKLAAAGERSSAQGSINVTAKNASELSGKLTIAYAANTDAIELVVIPRFLSWRLAYLRMLWQSQDFPTDLYSEGESVAALKQLPEGLQFPPSLTGKISHNADDQILIFNGVMSNEEHGLLLSLSPEPNYQEAVERLFELSQRPPFIDPDLIGPDDFRAPFAKAQATDPDKPFDLWLKRRLLVDQRLADLRLAREATGLEQILQSVLGDPLPNLDALLTKLTAGTQLENEQAQGQLNSLNLTLESLARLIAIRDKDRLASNDPKKEPVQPEEWEEVYAILTQAEKIKLFPEWRAEEKATDVLLGPELFWFSLREPVEGAWPPEPSEAAPLIDPDLVKVNELPESTAGRHALALWQARLARIEQTKRTLRDRLEQAVLDQDPDPLQTVVRHALGDPNPGDPLPGSLDPETLNTQLASTNPDEVNATTSTIDQQLHMPVDDFTRLMAIKHKQAPTPDELEEVNAILAKAQKVKREYATWLLEEQNAGFNTNYWLAHKARLPRWRATGESRTTWRQALRVHSRAPVIDPSLIGPGDIRNPTPGDPALGLWKARSKWVKERLATLKTKREAAPTELAGYDAILVETLIGDAALARLQAELKSAREANGLTYMLIQVWSEPMPELDTLRADLAAAADSVRTKARTTVGATLYLTVEEFELFMDIRQQALDGQPITAAEWQSVEGMLAEAALVKSIIGLDERRAGGEDIESRLEQLSLSVEAFAHLVLQRRLLVSDAPVLATEWDEVYAILVQAQKRRAFGAWRLEEQGQQLRVSPDDFKLATPPPLTFPPPVSAPLPTWLATQDDRQDWQNTLQTRIDQQQAVQSALSVALGATEEIALPKLRDALIWVSNTTGSTLDARAKWFGDRLLIDGKASGCQQTTRIAQAIETIQSLLFSVRTRILNDTYPDLDLDSDDFDEAWEWIGSYATWRTAMFVFLYPENILIPNLRRWQTPAFRSLVNALRSNRRLTPQQARQAAGTYADYFRDVCSLQLEVSCQTRTRVAGSDGNDAGYSYLLHMFARGGATNTVYWSWHDPEDTSGYAQSFWEPVTGLEHVLNLIGAVPFQLSEDQRFIYLFARVREKGTQKLVFIKYDLEQRTWDSEPTELELPEEATEFSAVVMQHTREGSSPRLAIRVPKGAIYIRQLNADGTDWADGEWVPSFGRGRGAHFTKLSGLVEFAKGGFCLIATSREETTSEEEIFYLLSGDWNDGHWRKLATGVYRGAFCWPQSSEVYVFWSENSQVKHRAIRPAGNLPISFPFHTVFQYNEWLKDVAGIGLEGVSVPSGMTFGGLTFYQLLTLPIDDPDDEDYLAIFDRELYAKSQTSSNQPSSLFEHESANFWLKIVPGLVEKLKIAAIDWLAGEIADTSDYLHHDFGDWKLAARATRTFFATDGESFAKQGVASPKALATVLKRVAGLEDGSVSARIRVATELSKPFLAMQGLKGIAPTSGAIDDTTLKQFGFQLSGGQVGVYRCAILRKNSGELLEFGRTRIAPRVTKPFTISEKFSEHDLQLRKGKIKQAYVDNKLGPRTNLTYLEEAYYFVPVHLALQLQARGQYAAALDWFRSLYDYSVPVKQRKTYYGLVAEEALAASYERAEDWLLDPLNPHAIAETRRNTYTRFTLLSLVRCLLEFADAEFTRDTPESVPRARLLYLTALELLDTPELKQTLGLCADIIGTLETQIGDAAWMPVWAALATQLVVIDDAKKLTELVEQIKAVQGNGGNPEVQFATANALFTNARAALPGTRSFSEVAEQKATLTTKLHAALSAQPEIAAAAQRAAANAATDLRSAVSLVTGTRADALEDTPMPWLRQKMMFAGDGSRPATAVTAARGDYLALTRSNPLAPTHLEKLATLAKAAPLSALKVASKVGWSSYTPVPSYDFCVPPNPVLKALRLRAELNLYKIRTCRNIAGIERQLELYAAPTDVVSGLPFIGAGGQLVLPGLATLRPTPYRYQVLIERAKQLVALAQQIEAAFLATVEKADAERYSILKARQDMEHARAGVRLQTLRVKEAEGGVKLAELQQERAQIQVDHYQKLIEEGPTVLEQLVLSGLQASAELYGQAVALSNIPKIIAGLASGNLTDFAQASENLARAASVRAEAIREYASWERREEEWKFQKALAQQDVRVGAQGVKIAEDHVRVVEQERVIAEIEADHAREVVDFLSTKFTNLELYDWMSGILEGVYSFFLQQATTTAQLATNQLAFERQEIPPPYIQSDYWEAPTEGFGSDSKTPDRRGLTGSARLLQDIYQLDQYAFDTNQRKLQLTKTISLAQMAPAEFQRFRENGVMTFDTPMDMFDRNFPGHYLRLIRQVRTSVIALIPPNQSIHATLSTTGTSRVVIGGEMFQIAVVNHGPQSVAVSSPRDATGLFELQQQPDMLLPFEGLGVATNWEFRMPKAANLFDYRTIADVLITIDYTALNSFDYYQQIIQTLKPTLSIERPFSFRHQFADQWYDLHNPDQTATPMTVRFKTVSDDFPPNLENLKIQQLVLYFARADGKSFEVPVSHLHLREQGAPGAIGGGASSTNGIISTLTGNAGSWTAMIGKAPFGEWELALPNTVEMRNRFKNEQVEDMLFVITFSGRTPEWPG